MNNISQKQYHAVWVGDRVNPTKMTHTGLGAMAAANLAESMAAKKSCTEIHDKDDKGVVCIYSGDGARWVCHGPECVGIAEIEAESEDED